MMGILLLGKLAAQENTGAVRIQGSASMLQLNLAFLDAYKKKSGQAIKVRGDGSSTGLKALIDGTADLAAASRPIKDSEIEKIKEVTGKAPKEIVVAFNAIGVYVHPKNPIDTITVNELKAAFFEGGEIATWDPLNKDVTKTKSGNLNLYGRSNASGTYVAFRDLVGGRRAKFKDGVETMRGSVALVEAIAKDPDGIGYTGSGYKDDTVKFLKVHTGKAGTKPALPDSTGVIVDGYPLVKKLVFYTAGEPQGEVKKFVDWLSSTEARKIVDREGFTAP